MSTDYLLVFRVPNTEIFHYVFTACTHANDVQLSRLSQQRWYKYLMAPMCLTLLSAIKQADA